MITEKCSGFPYMRQAGREWVAVCLSVEFQSPWLLYKERESVGYSGHAVAACEAVQNWKDGYELVYRVQSSSSQLQYNCTFVYRLCCMFRQYFAVIRRALLNVTSSNALVVRSLSFHANCAGWQQKPCLICDCFILWVPGKEGRIFTETLVYHCHTTRLHIPEANNLETYNKALEYGAEVS